jgi:glycosyltransferase involved in cell wall biosynthesis
LEPLISFVTTTYNRPGYLRECVASIRAQTIKDVEMIVVDDASDPALMDPLKSDPFFAGVRFVRHDQNRGHGEARRTGIAAARGRFIALHDDDDIWDPSLVERALAIMQNDPSIALFCCDAVVINERGEVQYDGRTFHEINAVIKHYPIGTGPRTVEIGKEYRLVYDGKARREEVLSETPAAPWQLVRRFCAERPFEDGWRNLLVWGDNLLAMQALLGQGYEGKVNLIYIDPPFDTGQDFSYTATIPDHPNSEGDDAGETSFVKEPSIIEQKAYRDTWGVGKEERDQGIQPLDKYLKWFYEAAVLLHELLADGGSMYVHIEPDIGNYIRPILDEIFAAAGLRTEIAWKRTSSHGNVSRSFGAIWESIFYYTKSAETWVWNQQYVEFDPDYIEQHFTGKDPDGRRWTTSDLRNPGYRPNLKYDYKGYKPHPNGWAISRAKMEELDRQGKLYFPKDKSGRIRLKRYRDESPGQIAQNIWLDIAPINSQAHEAVGYATQKPEALLQRIIKTSSNEGDLVLDCFVGSGTTAVVAEKLNRRWIACDLGRFATHTARKRLLEISGLRPFAVQNLGKYERQAWQAAEFAELAGIEEREARYRRFILELYHARPLTGHTWLHGVKGGRMVHIASVDAPVTLADVKAIAAEVWRTVGKGKDAPTTAAADILGWEFAFELNELARQIAAEARVDVTFKKIPREVLEKRAVEQGDIRFFELAAASTEVKAKKRDVVVKLTDFVVPPDDVPAEIQKAIKHWSQYVD